MARELRKFVNPKFTKTVDLGLMRRLLEPYAERLIGFDLATLSNEGSEARQALSDFFVGAEESHPQELRRDLHLISDLGTAAGLEILIEEAGRRGISLLTAVAGDAQESRQDPKQVALRVFLDHRDLFDAATAVLAYRSMSSCCEIAGADEGVELDLSDASQAAFEEKAKEIFRDRLHGDYCRLRSFEDGDDMVLVVTHGAPFKTTDTLEDGEERIISFRELSHAILSYSATSGRLKVGGVRKGDRQDIANALADTLLQRPEFFTAPDAQDLYTLEPVEQVGTLFTFEHDYDPQITRVQVIEVQANRMGNDPRSGTERLSWSMLVRDNNDDALERLADAVDGISFGASGWRLNHLVAKVFISTGVGKPLRINVKIKPPGAPQFKRARFEGKILELLRRNGIARDRQSARAALAAE